MLRLKDEIAAIIASRQVRRICEDEELTSEKLHQLLDRAVKDLYLEHVRREVAPFVRDQRALDVWSRTFWGTIAERIVAVWSRIFCVQLAAG